MINKILKKMITKFINVIKKCAKIFIIYFIMTLSFYSSEQIGNTKNLTKNSTKNIKNKYNNSKITNSSIIYKKKIEEQIYWVGLEKIINQFRISKNKKILNVQFLDFWTHFDYRKSIIFKILKERYKIQISKKPEYVFFSCFGFNHEKYFKQKPKPIFIQYIGENIVPEFNRCDYSIGFHHIFFEDRYLRMPIAFIRTFYEKLYKQRSYRKGKKFCAFVVSHKPAFVRNKFFKKLSEYKKVDSGGRYANNIGGRVKNKVEFLKNYKFSIQFENSKTNGYCTEKLIDAFVGQTIPIYYGDDTVIKYFNPKSFIHVKNEEDFPRAIEQIKQIDNDENLYKKMLKEPIFRDDLLIYKELKKFIEFLCNIFDQNRENARRLYDMNYTFLNNYISRAKIIKTIHNSHNYTKDLEIKKN